MESFTPAKAMEYETNNGYIVLSTEACYGEWWHTVLYRHIWKEPGGPNSVIIHVLTRTGVEPTSPAALSSLLEFAATQLPAAIEKQTS